MAPESAAVAGNEISGLDGILVINVRTYVQRRENIERQLRSRGLSYEFIHEYDASDIGDAVRDRYRVSPGLSLNALSCALKHVHALRTIVQRNWQHGLILEDDAILADDFVLGVRTAIQKSSLLDPLHVIHIGSGGNLYTPRHMRVPGKRLYRATKGRLAEAYIIGAEAARLRTQWIELNGISLPIDNLFDVMDHELQIIPYWLEDPVVEQGSKNGTFSSSIEPSPPRLVQRVKFTVQKLRRKYLYDIWS